MNSSISTSAAKQISTNTSGMIPMKPWKELDNILGSILVLSLMAVGENNMNTPILQINNKRTKGMNLRMIEGILDMYFWSILGPHV